MFGSTPSICQPNHNSALVPSTLSTRIEVKVSLTELSSNNAAQHCNNVYSVPHSVALLSFTASYLTTFIDSPTPSTTFTIRVEYTAY